jgi:hypothetical protein
MGSEVAIDGVGAWVTTIAAETLDPQFDVQYYFEFVGSDGTRRLWPDFEDEQPFFVVPVEAVGK